VSLHKNIMSKHWHRVDKKCKSVTNTLFLARDAVVRKNCHVIAVLFVCLSGQAHIVII